jgi:hypothetical protein
VWLRRCVGIVPTAVPHQMIAIVRGQEQAEPAEKVHRFSCHAPQCVTRRLPRPPVLSYWDISTATQPSISTTILPAAVPLHRGVRVGHRVRGEGARVKQGRNCPASTNVTASRGIAPWRSHQRRCRTRCRRTLRASPAGHRLSRSVRRPRRPAGTRRPSVATSTTTPARSRPSTAGGLVCARTV